MPLTAETSPNCLLISVARLRPLKSSLSRPENAPRTTRGAAIPPGSHQRGDAPASNRGYACHFLKICSIPSSPISPSLGVILPVAALAIMSGMMNCWRPRRAPPPTGRDSPNTTHHSSAVSGHLQLVRRMRARVVREDRHRLRHHVLEQRHVVAGAALKARPVVGVVSQELDRRFLVLGELPDPVRVRRPADECATGPSGVFATKMLSASLGLNFCDVR